PQSSRKGGIWRNRLEWATVGAPNCEVLSCNLRQIQELTGGQAFVVFCSSFGNAVTKFLIKPSRILFRTARSAATFLSQALYSLPIDRSCVTPSSFPAMSSLTVAT